MWEQACQRHEATILRPSSEKVGLDSPPIARHVAMTANRQRTLIITKLTQLTVKWMSRVFTFKPQACRTVWPAEFIGDLVLVTCCPFEGGDVGQSMHWHAECFMRVMFRAWSLAVQNLVRERLEARCEELKPQPSNRPLTLATMRMHQLVQAAVTELLWSRSRAERETVGTAPIGTAETPTRGGRTSAREKETTPIWLEEIPSRRDQGARRR